MSHFRYVNNRVEFAPASVRKLLDLDVVKWPNNGPCLALCDPKEVTDRYSDYLYNGVFNLDKTGLEIVRAAAYKNNKHHTNETFVRGKRKGRLKQNTARFHVQFSLRTTGHILARLAYRMIGYQGECQYNWKMVGRIEPLSYEYFVMLAQAWEDLGYMVKIEHSDYIDAELAAVVLLTYMT